MTATGGSMSGQVIPGVGDSMLGDSAAKTEGRRRCKCGVWESAHREGRGRCGRFRKASRVQVWLQDHSVWAHVAAPLWLRLPEKRRWTVVSWLDKSRRRCWSDLVSDALGYHESDPCDVHVPSIRGERAPRCASVCEWSHPDHTGRHLCNCYCGKFQFTAPDGGLDRKAAHNNGGSDA